MTSESVENEYLVLTVDKEMLSSPDIYDHTSSEAQATDTAARLQAEGSYERVLVVKVLSDEFKRHYRHTFTITLEVVNEDPDTVSDEEVRAALADIAGPWNVPNIDIIDTEEVSDPY